MSKHEDEVCKKIQATLASSAHLDTKFGKGEGIKWVFYIS